MTANLEDLTAALHGLADGWAADVTAPPALLARRARGAWRRRVAAIAATASVVVAGAVAVGVAVVPSGYAGKRPVTISASTAPPSYPGYTAVPLGSGTVTGDLTMSVRGALPASVPVVNGTGLIGVTEGPGASPDTSRSVVRDLDQASAGTVTDPAVGVTIRGAVANPSDGAVSGRGPGRPLVLSWTRPPVPLAVGQILVTAGDPGGVPVGTITSLLPSVYPDKHASRAEVTPFADLDHPGEIWELRRPGDEPTLSSAPPVTLPVRQQLSPTRQLLATSEYALSDFTSVDPTTGQPQTCLVTTIHRGATTSPDCRTAQKLGRDSLVFDSDGMAEPSADGGPTVPAVAFGRAGTSVARVVVVLDDGTRVEAKVVGGGTAYAGEYFAATWSGVVPADKALAYDAEGHQIGSTLTYYGSGGDF